MKQLADFALFAAFSILGFGVASRLEPPCSDCEVTTPAAVTPPAAADVAFVALAPDGGQR